MLLKQKALEDYYALMDIASRQTGKSEDHIRMGAARLIIDWHICEDEIRSGIATVNPTGQAGVGWAICKP